MKVALVVDSLSLSDGTGIAKYSRELLRGLRERGVEVEPIVGGHSRVRFGGTFKHVFELPYHTLRKARSCDIVHATSPSTGLCFPLLRKPKIMTYHDISSVLEKRDETPLRVRYLSPIVSRVGRWSTRIISHSSQTRDDLVRHFGFPYGNISVINPGVDSNFSPMNSDSTNSFVIGYVGAFVPRKRVDFLIRVFHEIINKYSDFDFKLVLCGPESGDYECLARMACELGVANRVQFLGFVPESEIAAVYNSFDVFTLCSDSEGFGLPILEAQACGIPVLIRSDARIPIETSEFCMKSKSISDMAEKIHQLAMDNTLRNEIIRNGMAHSRKFAWESTVDDTLDVYREVLQNSPG